MIWDLELLELPSTVARKEPGILKLPEKSTRDRLRTCPMTTFRAVVFNVLSISLYFWIIGKSRESCLQKLQGL